MKYLEARTVLVTGGTGSFGKTLVPKLLDRGVAAVRIFSRDELKQSEMARVVDDSRVRFLLGDIRDLDRLKMATYGVDLIVHAAALKQVPALEYNPFEAVKTNILGTENVLAAAIENEVALTVALSTDKAVAPTNLYGATKLCAERLVAQAGAYSRARFATNWRGAERVREPREALSHFAAVRYGNVVGSRGSVVPIFREQAKSGTLTITDERMTRFWITLDEAVDFVLSSIPLVQGGETFVPKIPSARVVDIAEAIAPDAEKVVVGIRPGEKIHETLLTEDEARQTEELEDRFVIHPFGVDRPRTLIPDGFRYSSDTNDQFLGIEDLRRLIEPSLTLH